MATLGDYTLTEQATYIRVVATDKTKKSYGPVPTPEEVQEYLGTTKEVRYTAIFHTCQNMVVAPIVPDGYGGTKFYFCKNLLLPSAYPPGFSGSCMGDYYSAYGLKVAPVLPKNSDNFISMFPNCTLKYGPTIPPNAKKTMNMFLSCSQLTGELIIRPDSIDDYTDMFKGTKKTIALYGPRELCEDLSATANNNNVGWSPWYAPVPPVTDRGQGSRTTYQDMNRIVRNGALAVSTYCPSRIHFNQGDVILSDEWAELIEAAQTIDPTITSSSHYANLNKIEAAFASAL